MTVEVSWVSILPPLTAIGLAIIFRQVIIALVAGVWLGALILSDYNPATAFLRTVDTYVVNAVADRDQASVIIFSLLLGGMVGIMARSGGAHGLAKVVTRFATNARRGQLSSWFLGLLIFFDDYANTLLVGSTMRPITDRLRISREKLAFIVDATAAPVASIAIISSWIGVEIGYIADQFQALGIEGDAYIVFLKTIPHRFYPLLMLMFCFMVAVSRRDFGPMLRAERRALHHGKLLADSAQPASSFEDPAIAPVKNRPHRWINALVPVFTVIVAIGAGMTVDGYATVINENLEPSLRNIFSQADSFKALLWASATGSLMALIMTVTQKILSLPEALEAWLSGVRSMLLAIVILVLAWSLGAVCEELRTAEFIIRAIGDRLHPALLPASVFLVSGIVSFSTGTSWGTMGILFPLVIPLAHGLAPGEQTIMLGTISSILGGAVWGDHCSPISDTTIMSSMASSCDHIDHVRTQLPYAMLVGGVGLLLGDLASGVGLWNQWVGLLLGIIVLAVAVRILGRPIMVAEKTAQSAGRETNGR